MEIHKNHFSYMNELTVVQCKALRHFHFYLCYSQFLKVMVVDGYFASDNINSLSPVVNIKSSSVSILYSTLLKSLFLPTLPVYFQNDLNNH